MAPIFLRNSSCWEEPTGTAICSLMTNAKQDTNTGTSTLHGVMLGVVVKTVEMKTFTD